MARHLKLSRSLKGWVVNKMPMNKTLEAVKVRDVNEDSKVYERRTYLSTTWSKTVSLKLMNMKYSKQLQCNGKEAST
jgi:hypothetical protein